MGNLGYKPEFEVTEEEVTVKNIFNLEDEKMIGHLLKKCMGLSDQDSLPEGMIESPHRIAKYWTEHMASGYIEDPKKHLLKTFDIGEGTVEDTGEFTRGMVVSKFKLFSTCEHHQAVFGNFDKDSWTYVIYIPGKRVVGLSKIPRMARGYAHRFQLQERLSENIADAMMEVLQPKGVTVVMKNATHTCVAVRGAKAESATTTTSVMRGCFETDSEARAEALALIKE